MTGKRFLIALAWVALALMTTLGLVYLFQRSLIYLPSQTIPPLPEDVDEVRYDTEDGLTLSAWLVGPDNTRGSVIVFNGNAGNRSVRLPLGRALAADGYTVLLTDYRGFGGNPGRPSEDGLASDARAAVAYMTGRFGRDRLFYFGESLGAAVALGLATEAPPNALVLRSPFTSLADIAAVHYRYLPTSLLLRDRYPNLERIRDIETPLLVIAGDRDEIVPVDQSRDLYEVADVPKELLVVEDAGHNDPALLDGDEMVDAVSEFLSRVDP